MRSLAILISATLLTSPVWATPAPIENLFKQLDGENDQIQAARLDREFKEQNLVGSKSRLYPSLNLSLVANEGEDNALAAASPSSLDSGASSPGGGLGTSPSGSISDSDISTNGWASQLSLGYFVFTGFAVSEDVHRAKNSVASAKLGESKVSMEKKAQLLQLLLEYHNLNRVAEPLNQAVSLMDKVKSFSKKRSNLLYTTDDRLNLNEKEALLEYQKIRLEEGQSLVAAGLRSLLPSMNDQTLAGIPRFEVTYPLPSNDQMPDLYEQGSIDHKINKLSEASTTGYLKVARWNRPWVPTVYTSASYSYTGDYKGETADGGWSASITMNFPLFDGFYSGARLQQARIGSQAAELRTKAEKDKRLLYIRHQRMKALVAGAEYKHLALQAAKQERRYQDVQKKIRQGIASRLELSAASLELAKARLEASDKMKEHQQALLNVAVELNQWDRVVVNEISNP